VHGWNIYEEYNYQESSGKTDRSEFKQLLLEAYQKKLDPVLFWSLDRFSHRGHLEAHLMSAITGAE
jgi:DNA invertase Pin-like site-specific DNA recombinase